MNLGVIMGGMSTEHYVSIVSGTSIVNNLNKKKYKILEVKNMFNEEIFNFNIDNIKNDLAIEGMEITDIDVNLYRQFANEEIDMPQLINTIKNEIEIGGTYEG